MYWLDFKQEEVELVENVMGSRARDRGQRVRFEGWGPVNSNTHQDQIWTATNHTISIDFSITAAYDIIIVGLNDFWKVMSLNAKVIAKLSNIEQKLSLNTFIMSLMPSSQNVTHYSQNRLLIINHSVQLKMKASNTYKFVVKSKPVKLHKQPLTGVQFNSRCI